MGSGASVDKMEKINADLERSMLEEAKAKLQRELIDMRVSIRKLQEEQSRARQMALACQADCVKMAPLFKEYRSTIFQLRRENKEIKWRYFDSMREVQELRDTVRKLREQQPMNSLKGALKSMDAIKLRSPNPETEFDVEVTKH